MYDTFLSKVKDLELNTKTLLVALKYAMEVVEVSELKGEAQKKEAIILLKRFVLECSDSAIVTSCLKMIDGGVVDTAIDMVVDATKGKLLINQTVEVAEEAVKKAVSCFGC